MLTWCAYTSVIKRCSRRLRPRYRHLANWTKHTRRLRLWPVCSIVWKHYIIHKNGSTFALLSAEERATATVDVYRQKLNYQRETATRYVSWNHRQLLHGCRQKMRVPGLSYGVVSLPDPTSRRLAERRVVSDGRMTSWHTITAYTALAWRRALKM